jgi:DNA ligase-1
LSQFSGLDTAVIAHRLMGQWEATPEFYQQLLSSETRDTDISRPYPFFLAHPLGDPPEKLGDMRQWESEWKWDGIRAQVIKRQGKVFIWSRGEELVTDKYPELVKPLDRLPDGSVLDGEILPWQKDRPLIFAELQRRIGRKNITKKILREVPAVLMAYDLLEYDGKDIRTEPLYRRKQVLASLIASAADPTLKLSPGLNVNDWQALAGKREDARRYGVEGLMLKRLDSPYHVGRRRGDWWKWKLDPLQVDAVLVYAQRGHGRRSGLYTDYTFAVWNEDSLVPIAKAYSGLTDREIRQVDRFIRQNTREQFGPVRSVTPALVFEIAFEDIWISKRHKSGIAVRFPRISRWRHDKPIEEADTLTSVKALLNAKSIIDPMGGND